MATGAPLYVAGGTVTLNSDNVSFNTAQGGQGGSLVSDGYLGRQQSGGSGFAGGLYDALGGTVYVNSSTLSGNIAQGGMRRLVPLMAAPPAPSAASDTGVRL